MTDRPARPLRICIVGGGFSGAATAVQLVRASEAPLSIEIVEPREELGRGMAYTAPDPDWRLNGGIDTHVTDLADPGELIRWCAANGILEADPDATARNENVFVRRHDFGSFMRDQVAAHSRMPNGSRIVHVCDVAIDAEAKASGVAVRLRSGRDIEADLLVIATGNAPGRLPAAIASVQHDARVLVEALDTKRLRDIPADASVLLAGAGLTALDVASTLVREEHRGRVTALSRHGLRPRLHRLAPPSAGPTQLERTEGAVPPFVAAAAPTARGLLRALRSRIRDDEAAGSSWYAAFDALRDVLWQVWPKMPAAEKRRALRWLRPWYDVHRFRAPPQNHALVRDAERRGLVAFRTGRLRGVDARDDGLHVRIAGRSGADTVERFDYLVNCTGLDPASGARENPFLAALLDRGLITIDASGVGFAVDVACRAVDAHGHAQPRLYMIGPPTAGTFGDPLGVLFIAPQIRRVLPTMLRR